MSASVRFTSDFGNYSTNDVASFPEDQAQLLVERGVAEAVAEEKPSKKKPAVAEDDAL
jgi:hypothetical protein